MDVLRVFGAVVLSGSIAVVAQNASSSPTASEVETLRTAIAANPNDAESHFRLGDALERSGDLSTAESEYKKSLALQEKKPNALGALAYLYSTQKRFTEAEAALRSYIALDASNTKAHVQLGSLLLSNDKRDQASKELDEAVRLAPGDASVLNQVAQLYSAHGMYPQAYRLFANLVQISPSDAEGHYKYGAVLMQLKRFPIAQSELQRAISLRPDLTEAYGDLAVAAAENKDFAMSIRALDARARYLPESAGTYFLRATSYDHLKQFAPAVDNYKKFLAVDAGKSANQEWQARHRLVAIEKK